MKACSSAEEAAAAAIQGPSDEMSIYQFYPEFEGVDRQKFAACG